MSKYDLSVIIPSRNEEWLNRTIIDVLENSSEKAEVIAIIDGQAYNDILPEPHERLTIVLLNKSVGQRSATNIGVRLSKAKWVAKADGHTCYGKNFDTILLADAKDNQAIVPTMKNFHVFDWVCELGHRRYQGPSGKCLECGKPTEKDVVWRAKESPNSRSYCFDSEPHFQYFGDYLKRMKKVPDITQTMSLQGSFFMVTRKKYWELGLGDEKLFSNWGSQGLQIANSYWLTGGEVVVNNKTHYAHMFRTQGGDFTFPYPISHKETLKNRERARQNYFHSKWRKQVYPMSWLLEKFWPVKGWEMSQLIAQKNTEIKSRRSGIYSIEDTHNKKLYIFGAPDIWEDASRQEYLLRQGEHPNKELQGVWDREDGIRFVWHVEMFCREESLPKFIEQYKNKADNQKIKHVSLH
jgi:glycosyltransferase involved in cell wall biosynthesis